MKTLGELGTSPQHLDFVDSLRGLAILGVLAVHIAMWGPVSQVSKLLAGTMVNGQLGVQLFFVVSAFTLFWSLRFRKGSDRRPIAAFFVRRFFRIAPLFWLGAAFYLLYPSAHQADYSPDGMAWWKVALTLGFVHGWYPTTINAVVPGGWSIGDEAMFYLLIPLLFRWVRSLRTAAGLTLVCCVLAGFASTKMEMLLQPHFLEAWRPVISGFAYYWFPSQLPVFCCGIVLYFAVLAYRFPSGETLARNVGLIVTAALLIVLNLVSRHATAAFAFTALAFALSVRPLGWLVNPVTEYLGKISFSIYIWHFAIIDLAIRVADHVMPGRDGHSVALMRVLVISALTVGLSVPVAAISYHLIERPGQWIGKWLIERLRWGAPPRRSGWQNLSGPVAAESCVWDRTEHGRPSHASSAVASPSVRSP